MGSVDWGKNAHEICELSSIWGKMISTAWETAFQTGLSNGSKEAGEGQYVCDFGERRVHGIKHAFLQTVTASHKEQTSP